jgi:hypothetical protein
MIANVPLGPDHDYGRIAKQQIGRARSAKSEEGESNRR